MLGFGEITSKGRASFSCAKKRQNVSNELGLSARLIYGFNPGAHNCKNSKITEQALQGRLGLVLQEIPGLRGECPRVTRLAHFSRVPGEAD